MINVLELEKRHANYIKIKKTPFKWLLPVVIVFILIVVISFFLISFTSNDNQDTHTITKIKPQERTIPSSGKKEIIPIQKLPESLTQVSQSIQKIESQPVKVEALTSSSTPSLPSQPVQKLVPSMNFIDEIHTKVINTEPQRKEIKKESPTQEKTHTIEQIFTKKETLKNSVSTTKIEESGTKIKVMHFEKQQDPSDLQDVIQRFKRNKNPSLSLFIAKRYYQMQKYYYAYNYALTTNELDSNIEDSWLIFTKSLVKLKQKKRAIDTLQKYIAHSHSQKAKILLDSIENGTFK